MTEAQKAKAYARETAWRAANRERNNAAVRAYRARNPGKAAAWHRAQTEKYPERYMLKAARARARKAGVVFNLDEADIRIPDVCPVLGIPLSRGAGRGMHDASPSLDRIDPARGYEKGNIAVISNRANRLKNDGSADEHERIAAWMRKAGTS